MGRSPIMGLKVCNLFFVRFIFLMLALLIFFPTSKVWPMFSTQDCVLSNYKDEVLLKKGLLSFIDHTVKIEKNRCLIKITHQRVLTSTWNIDLCREPVHVKISKWWGDDFYLRKNYPCPATDLQFCQSVDELEDLLQNEALIYAEGERETLATPHGKFYCAQLLLKNYLIEGNVFSYTIPNLVPIFKGLPIAASEEAAASINPSTETTAGSEAQSSSAVKAEEPAASNKSTEPKKDKNDKVDTDVKNTKEEHHPVKF